MLAPLVLAASCGGNTLRIEGANAVGEAAGTFTASAERALDDARARRTEANAALVAANPSCEPLARIYIYVPEPETLAPEPPLCADGLAATRAGYSIQAVDLRPIQEEQLKPTLLLIGAIGDYGAALSEIAAEPGTDIGAELAKLAAKADAASGIANALQALDLPSASDLLATDQASSAIALAHFANDLAEEQAKVKDIAALVDSRGDTVMATVPELESQLETWLRIVAQGDAQIVQNSLADAYRAERDDMDFDRRLDMVGRINAARAQQQGYPQKLADLKAGLASFAMAESELRRLLRGEWTEEERRRIASLNRQRMVEAIGLMTRAVSALGVV